ncbi:adenosylmethionine--8-amino-7-oxononanoate transaminase [uncultured Lawsonella sp.]|uniref:adenosylmethionine--8-amino-7-oxononanoate transaminase n=1 Tax=uncultured Lawsonella sp. TaxID=1847727 RepID=UPI00260C37CD|nr:adenosylmethionine--8-amino-7-oxononanoate transaminase [uncultured Lawsonella sp.]
MASVDTIVTTDRDHVWHPYSPIPGPTQHIVTAAEGPYLTLDIDARFLHEETSNGRLDCHVLDGMSSWWAAAYGYRNPTLDAAAHHQIDTFSHVMFGGLTHEPATTLAQTLLTLAPAGLSSIFFCDSGSVSVEVAVKMALQYWRSHTDTSLHRKTKLLTWRGGYHGDTFTPMSVCDPDGGMHTLWQGVVQPQMFLPAPPVDQETSLRPAPSEISIDEYLAEAEHVLSQRADTLAACIIEPVVQGAGGMRFHQPELVRGLSELCRRYHVLVIFDEIATGFGRTGTLFAADACHCTPDIMCVGKALTGGYLTAAAVLSTRDIAETISTGTGALMHGPTFMANPLACAIGQAACSLAVRAVEEGQAVRIERELRRGLAPACDLPGVADVRVKGAIGVVQLVSSAALNSDAATAAALREGVWLRPFRDLIYCMPPFICTDEQIATICRGMVAAAHTATV